VVQATDTVIGREVALKVLPLARTSAVGRERFLREIKLLAELSHPGIIPIFDAGEGPGVLWYAMPLARGDTLATRIAQGPVEPHLVQQWGAEVAEALAVAHAHGVVHRDVKPANIHLMGGHALLADFGVAALEGEETLTSPGDTPGSRRYMAPEQWRGSVDARADVYGLGASLIEAATGTPWEPSAPNWARVPRVVRASLTRAVAEDVSARWATATEFQSALRLGPRHRRRVLVVPAALVIALVGALVLLNHRAPIDHAVDLVLAGVDGDPLMIQLGRATVTRLEWFPPLHTAPWTSNAGVVRSTWRVEGSVERSPDGAVAMIPIRDTTGRVLQLLTIPGDSLNIPAWASAIADAIVAAVAPTRLGEFRGYGGGARDGNALRHFYEGQDAFERQDWTAAERAFREAVRVDSGFDQARWSMLIARKWARLPYEEELRTLAAMGSLPPPLGLLVTAQLEPDLGRRLAMLDTLAATWPTVADVQLVRANELFHRGALAGRPLTEALDALETAARTFPSLDRPVVWDHVAWGAIRLGDRDRARNALAAQSVTARGGDPWSTLLRYAVESRFRPVVGRGMEWGLTVLGGGSRDQLATSVRLGVTFDLPQSQLRLAEWLDRSENSPARRASDWSAIAIARLMMGQPRRALAALDSAATFLPNDPEFDRQRWEWRLLLPVAGISVDEGEQSRALEHLTGFGTEGSARAAGVLAVYRDVAASLLEGVPRAPADMSAGKSIHHPFHRAISHLTAGAVHLAKGDTARALTAWRWAENLDLQGWPSGAPQEGELDAALSPIARLRRAAVLMDSDRREEACGLIAQVQRLWRNADREVVALLLRPAFDGCRP
jgi:tetratricopeptide (TPR) repeat protein